MSIQFTQYLLPNGRRLPVFIDMPADIEALAKDLINHGAKFDVEMLTTGQMSFTCELEEDVLAIEITPNGPPVVEAVEAIVRRAHKRVFP